MYRQEHGWRGLSTGEHINAETMLALFKRIEGAWPLARTINVFHDNVRYHHMKMLKLWLERLECHLRLHFLPPYAPLLNPIERLLGVMHRHVRHNFFHLDFRRFVEAITDNYRVTTHD